MPNSGIGILIVLMLTALGLGAVSALANDVSPQIWFDYNPSHRLSPKVDIFGTAGIRWEMENDGWLRLVLSPSVGVPAGKVRLSFGVANFFTFNEVIEDRWEIRPYQGVTVIWPGGRLSVEHFLRLEERFDFNMENWNSLNSLRLRYLLRASYRWAAYEAGRTWKATASVEPFVTLTGQQGQQRELVRATVGVERTLSHDRRLEFDISWQQESLVFRPDEYVSDIFLRVRWFVRW